MKPNLILHIGSPKTGTSSIQRTLINNKELLSQHGYHYLECLQWHDGAHHELAFSIRGLHYNNIRKEFEDCLDEIKNEINNVEPGIQTIIISSEILFYNSINERNKINKLLNLFENTTLVCALRDPVDFLTSLYKQMVKDPNDKLSIRPSDFLKKRLQSINYERVIESYTVKNKKIIPYSSRIVEVFISETLNINKKVIIEKRVLNQTMDGAELKLKLRSNQEIRDYNKNKDSIEKIKKFVKYKKIPNRNLNIFKEDELKEIKKYFNLKNKNILNKVKLENTINPHGEFDFFPVSDDLFEEFKKYYKELF